MKKILRLIQLNIAITVLLFSALFILIINQNAQRQDEFVDIKSKTITNGGTIDYTRNLVKVLLFAVNNDGYQKWLSMPNNQKVNLMEKSIDLDEIRSK